MLRNIIFVKFNEFLVQYEYGDIFNRRHFGPGFRKIEGFVS